jgi:hypothetical protein
MENIMAEVTAPADAPVTGQQITTTGKQYLHPYWANKENRHLIVTIKQPNGKESIASIQDKDGTNPDMKAVLELYTEEQIMKNTDDGLRRRNENLRKQAERRESQRSRALQEELFSAKLLAFEIDAVKNSKNSEMKRKIRKAKSVMEVHVMTTALVIKDMESEEEAK